MKNDQMKTCVSTCLKEGHQWSCGFTILELLVVVGIISLLMALSIPVLTTVRRHMRSVVGANNQKQIVAAVNLYSFDNEGRVPETIATVGDDLLGWNWSEPTKLIGDKIRSPGLQRSASGYLRKYLTDAEVMFCPNAPRKHKYLQQAWDAGDDWDNPDTPLSWDPLSGTYCLYWNYVGFLEERDHPFRGPRTVADGRMYSKLLVSDYFGYDHWRSPNEFGSCEQFKSAGTVGETWLLSSFWTVNDQERDSLKISLHAGYTDGHVESFNATETVTLRVSLTSDGSVPYPIGVGPGLFVLPLDSLE